MARIVRASKEKDMAEVQQIYAHEVVNGGATFEKRAPNLEEMLRRRHKLLLQGLPHLVSGRSEYCRPLGSTSVNGWTLSSCSVPQHWKRDGAAKTVNYTKAP